MYEERVKIALRVGLLDRAHGELASAHYLYMKAIETLIEMGATDLPTEMTDTSGAICDQLQKVGHLTRELMKRLEV